METYRKLSLLLSLFIINLFTVIVKADIADIPRSEPSNMLPIFVAIFAGVFAALIALNSRKNKK